MVLRTDWIEGQVVDDEYLNNLGMEVNSKASLEDIPDIPESSGIEVGYVVNETAIKQAVGATAADVAGLVLEIPPQTRPIWISFHFHIGITSVGTAHTTYFGILTDDANVAQGVVMDRVPTGGAIGGWITLSTDVRIGPTTETKTFKVRALRSGTGTGEIIHGDVSPEYRSWMAAYLR